MNYQEFKKTVRNIFVITMIAVIAMVSTTLYGISALASERKVTYQDNVAAAQRTSEMVKDVYPALVGIYTEVEKGVGFGSGFLYKVEGETAFVMTNAHVVVDGKKDSVVYFSDKSKVQAKLLGKDDNRDVAVLSIPKSALPSGYKTVNFGDSDKLSLAEPIVAIGNPIEPEFFGTTTTGVVSGVSRLLRMETRSQKKAYYQEFIQIDAAINRGNSGGPLFNLAGQIVGMNSLAIASKGKEPVANFAFSIPSSTLKTIVSDLEKGENLGIVVLGITPADSIELQVESPKSESERVDGMKIRKVDESGVAAVAGLKKDDVITKIDDREVHSTRDFMRIIANKKKGDKSKIMYTREGGSKDTVIEFSEVVQ